MWARPASDKYGLVRLSNVKAMLPSFARLHTATLQKRSRNIASPSAALLLEEKRTKAERFFPGFQARADVLSASFLRLAVADELNEADIGVAKRPRDPFSMDSMVRDVINCAPYVSRHMESICPELMGTKFGRAVEIWMAYKFTASLAAGGETTVFLIEFSAQTLLEGMLAKLQPTGNVAEQTLLHAALYLEALIVRESDFSTICRISETGFARYDYQYLQAYFVESVMQNEELQPLTTEMAQCVQIAYNKTKVEALETDQLEGEPNALGQGSFGGVSTVHHAWSEVASRTWSEGQLKYVDTRNPRNEVVALKTVDMKPFGKSGGLSPDQIREIAIVKTIHTKQAIREENGVVELVRTRNEKPANKFIISIYDAIILPDMGQLRLYFPKAEMSLLAYVLEKMPATESVAKQQTIRIMCKQLLLALERLEDLAILHRDVKPENVLVRKAEGSNGSVEGYLVLADFGLARFWAPTNKIRTTNKRDEYMALSYRPPEYILSTLVPPIERIQSVDSPAGDIWSLGCVIAAIQYQRDLFPTDARDDESAKASTVLREQFRWFSRAEIESAFSEAAFQRIISDKGLQSAMASLCYKQERWYTVSTDAPAGTAEILRQQHELVDKMLRAENSRRIRATEALRDPYIIVEQSNTFNFEFDGVAGA